MTAPHRLDVDDRFRRLGLRRHYFPIPTCSRSQWISASLVRR